VTPRGWGLRRLLGAVEARADVELRWRGGEVDRLVDDRQAQITAKVASALAALGWRVHPEVTFQHFGERGSVDLLAAEEEARAVLIVDAALGAPGPRSGADGRGAQRVRGNPRSTFEVAGSGQREVTTLPRV
jgi:hypothetical protein